MPLMKYFGFAGSALVLLLFGLDWLLPQPVSERIRSGTERSVIRISSAEQLPERVVIDTSLPTIVPPPSAVDFAESPPQSTFVEINSGPRQAILNADSTISKKQSREKREQPMKKVTVHQAPPTVHNEPAPNHNVQAAAPATRMSLLEILKERLGQSLFKLN
jgi:hypothetical protein